MIEIVELPKIYDPRGSLTVAEEGIHIPFTIEKVEWIKLNSKEHSVYDISEENLTSGENQNGDFPIMLVALSGQITIQASNKPYTLTCPHQALVCKEKCAIRIGRHSEDALLLKIMGIEKS